MKDTKRLARKLRKTKTKLRKALAALEQEKAERFVVAWELSQSVEVAAAALPGQPPEPELVLARATWLLREGVNLKAMPDDRPQDGASRRRLACKSPRSLLREPE